MEDQLIQARVKMLLKLPYYGHIAARMPLIDATDWCPTFATNGRDFFYNRDLIKELSIDELVFCFAHEVSHLVDDHFSRIEKRHGLLWNCAGDFVINAELVDNKIGTMPVRENLKPCFDEKYDNMVTEEVYDLLLVDNPEMEHEFDMHDIPSEFQLDGEEAAQVENEMNSIIINAAKSGGDSTPKSVKRLIDELLRPKMDWREILQSNLLSTIKDDYTFSRRAKKSPDGIYLPGHNVDKHLDVDLAIDTSGSISNEEIRQVMSEIKGITEQFHSFNIRAWCFDTRTYKVQSFDSSNIDEIANFEIEGGGGTDFMVNWNLLKKENRIPDQFVIMTDGYPNGSWGDENYVDTVFIINGSKDIEAPFGTTCYYK